MTEALSPPRTAAPAPAPVSAPADPPEPPTVLPPEPAALLPGEPAAVPGPGRGSGPARGPVADPAPAAGSAAPGRLPASGAQPAAVRGTRRRLGPGRAVPFGRLLGPALLLAVWWAASALHYLDPRILSGPGTVASTALDLIRSGRLQDNVEVSLQRAALGLLFGVTVGVLLAVAAGLSRFGEYLLDGTLQVKRAIPSLALLPLLILWLGIGEQMKVTVIALGVAVVVYINTYASLTGIDSRYVELAESLDLTRWQFVRRVVVPGALPGFFVGLRLGVTASWLSLVVVEQVNATKGLGYMMFQAQQYAQSDVIVVGLVAYGIFGFVSDAAVRTVERRVLSWRRTLAG